MLLYYGWEFRIPDHLKTNENHNLFNLSDHINKIFWSKLGNKLKHVKSDLQLFEVRVNEAVDGSKHLSLMTSLHVEDSEVFKTVDIEVISFGLELVTCSVVCIVFGHHICHFLLGDIDISFFRFLSVAFPIRGLHQCFQFAFSDVGTFKSFSTKKNTSLSMIFETFELMRDSFTYKLKTF